MKLPKIRNGAEVRLISRRQDSKRHVLHQALLDLARRKYPHAIAIDQDLSHHPRMIRRLTPLFLFIHALDRRKIQLIYHVRHEISQVLIRQPLP
jgi:hypothetical protein